MASKKRTVRTARQLFRLCVVNGTLDENRVRKVVAGVIGAKRRGFTRVLTEFERLVRLDRERHTAIVESAVPLPDPIRAEVSADLTRTHGPGIAMAFAENPALIGGMRIKVGSDVYDGSVRGKLDAIESGL